MRRAAGGTPGAARRAWLWRAWQRTGAAGAWLLGGGQAAGGEPLRQGVRRGRALQFPADHGAHLDARVEWWYVTGWLAPEGAAADPRGAVPSHGFQVTFFRSRVGAEAAGAAAPAPAPSRFAPRHLLFAHAAITDLAARRHLHAQRLGRWNGNPDTGPDRAALDDAELKLARWTLQRERTAPASGSGSGSASMSMSMWRLQIPGDGFALAGTLRAVAPPLLQGDAGFSRKGPEESQASHYYSLPQLDARLTLSTANGTANGASRTQVLTGRAWLDHEWSDELLHPQAVGWDWIGFNLFDGRALTAFRLRRADGSVLWAGGSLREAGPAPPAARDFAPDEVRFEPGRAWRSPATHAAYPVQWQVRSPAGRHTVRALLDAQELDSRGGTGAVYWEGLAELLDERGARVGLGYLEMTGYAAPIRLA